MESIDLLMDLSGILLDTMQRQHKPLEIFLAAAIVRIPSPNAIEMVSFWKPSKRTAMLLTSPMSDI